MSILPNGVLGKGVGVLAAVGKQLKRVTLLPTDSVTVTFDPFHAASPQCRDFIHFMSSPKITGTNSNCKIKTEIVCDRREPSILFKLNSSFAKDYKTVNIKAGNLTILEILQVYNSHITSLVPLAERPVHKVEIKPIKIVGAKGRK